MRTLFINKRDVYISHRRDTDSKIMTYDTPILYRINFTPLEDEAEISVWGEHYNEILRGVLSVNEAKNIHEFDRVFVEVLPPLEHNILCDEADFEVVSVSSTINVTKITIRKRL